MDRLLHRVRGMVERGERISVEDCRGLFALHNLNEFSKLARIVRERRYGKEAFYKATEVFEYTGEHPELFLSEMETVADPHASELLLKPVWSDKIGVDIWLERFAAFGRSSQPVRLCLDGLFITRASENEAHDARSLLASVSKILPVLVSGKGAELFNDSWRTEYSPEAISSERWLAVHQAAHEAGLKSGAAMTYYNGWEPDLYVAHLQTLRSLQDRTGGFLEFTPMGFNDTRPDAVYPGTPTGGMTLKVTAISRLFLDNIPHITAVPALGDPEIAWAALDYGADTVDRTIQRQDLSSLQDKNAQSGSELVVLPESSSNNQNKLALEFIEDRMYEARWNPVPVNSNYERLATEEIS